MRRIMRAWGSQARTPIVASTPSRREMSGPAIPTGSRVRWSGGSASQAPANCTTSTGRPSQSETSACSRSAERGRVAKKPGIVHHRLDADREARATRCGVPRPVSASSDLGDPVFAILPGEQGGVGVAMLPVFRAGVGEHRAISRCDSRSRKSGSAARAVAQLLVTRLGIVPRQHAGGPGQPDQPEGQSMPACRTWAGSTRSHLRRRIGQAVRRAEPRRLGRVGGAAVGASTRTAASKEKRRGSFGEALERRRRAVTAGRASRRAPARRRRGPGLPRSTARVRTKELTVACSARKRSSTEASRYSPALCHAALARRSSVTSRPRQNDPPACARRPAARRAAGRGR